MEDVLVIVYRGSTVPRGSNDTGAAAGKETLEDLHTDTSLTHTREKSSLLRKGYTRSRDFRQDVQVCDFRSAKLVAVVKDNSQIFVSF